MHTKHVQSRARQLHYLPNGDPEQAAPTQVASEHILDDPEDPNDPLLEPVLHRGPHEKDDAEPDKPTP